MLSREQIDILRQYTDEDIDRRITKNNLPIVDPMTMMITRERYQPGFVSGLRMQ